MGEMMLVPRPRRPAVNSKRAKSVLEWADTAFYVFCLLLVALIAVVTVIHSWDLIGVPQVSL